MAQTVEEIIIDLRLKTQALEEGLAEASHQIEQFTNKSENAGRKQAQAAKQSSQEQQVAYAAISAAGVAAFLKILNVIDKGIEKANAYTSALTGLRSVAEGSGRDFGSLQNSLNELTDDGLIPVSDAATALKNLLARGFNEEQAVDMLNRLKDSAAFGRQASLTMGEAVRSASEGLKNENSILVDNAGVTKNVSVMWKEYAAQIGKGVDSLTTAEKRQAEYNGIMNETRFQVGDAAKYAETYAGAQAELSASTLRLEQAHGSAMQNALLPFTQMLSAIVDWLARLAKANPEVAAGLTVAALAAVLTAAGFTAVAVAGTKLAAVLVALQAAAGPIGWISLAAGGIAAVVSGFTNAAKSAEEYTQKLQDSINTARQEQAVLREYQQIGASNAATAAELATARQKIIDQSPELIIGYDGEGNAIVAGNDKIQEKIALLDEQIAREKEFLLLQADKSIETAKGELDMLREEGEEKRRIYEESTAAYEAAVERRVQLDKEYQAASANGPLGENEARNFGEAFKNVEAAQNIALANAQNASRRMGEISSEVTEQQSSIAKNRLAQYEQEIAAMGELSAFEQYVVDTTAQKAAERNLTVEQYLQLLEEADSNERTHAKMLAEFAAQATASSEAVSEWADAEKNLKKIQEAGTAVAQAKKIKDYTTTVKAGKKGTAEYAEALKALANYFGLSEDAVKSNIDALVGLADIGLAGATTAQEKMRASLQQAIADLKATGTAAAGTVEQLEALLAIFDQLGADTTKNTGGGGSTRKKAWEEELDMIDRVMDAECEYTQAYLDHINSLLASDRLSKSERKRLEQERAYAQMQVDGELEQAHIDYLERVLARERLSAEQRLEVEQQLFEAKRALMDNYSDFADAIISAITARAEAQRDAELSAIQAQIDAVSDWENAQSDAIRAVMDERIDAINAQIRALDDLSKAQDRADKDEEDADKLRRLQAQLAFEKDERNRQKLTEQIAALETSTKKRHAQEQLEDQKQKLKDQQDAIRDEGEKQLDAIKTQADAEREMLNQRLASAQAYWEQRLSVENIMQEAILFLQQSNQEEILALLDKYAPEYLGKGKLLGSQLLGGLKPKIDACISEIARLRMEAEKPITVTVGVVYKTTGAGGNTGNSGSGVGGLLNSITTFAADPQTAVMGLMANVQSAMDSFAARSLQPAASATGTARNALSAGGQSTRNVKVEQTVVLQQLVPTPYQTAKALRRESENLAKLL